MKNHPIHKNNHKVYHQLSSVSPQNEKKVHKPKNSKATTGLSAEFKLYITTLIKRISNVSTAKHTHNDFKVHSSLGKQREILVKTIKQRESDFQLFLFPLILLIILFCITIINDTIYKRNLNQELPSDSIKTQINPYPFTDAIQTPEITAQSALVLDRSSQVILFSKNPQLRFSMASTTKIMTALTALNYYHEKDILTVKSPHLEGSSLLLQIGDQVTFEDLLYMMLLPSSNDAAQAIADNYPGGKKAFIAEMNNKAKSLKLNDTHFTDPAGLDDDGDYTTAVDLARLASYGIANPKFVDITSTKYKTVRSLRYGQSYELENLNTLLGEQGVTGIKTGTTEGAGQVLVTATTKKDKTFIIVVLHSKNRFQDTGLLLHFIDDHVKYMNPVEEINKLEKK